MGQWAPKLGHLYTLSPRSTVQLQIKVPDTAFCKGETYFFLSLFKALFKQGHETLFNTNID